MNKLSIIKFSFLDIVAFLLGMLLIFMQPLISISDFFAYSEEIVLVVLFIVFLCETIKGKKINNVVWWMLPFFCVFVFFGVISNLVSNITFNLKSILFDIISFAKFPAIFVCGYSFFEDTKNNQTLLKAFSFVIKIIIAVGLPLAICQQFVDLGMSNEIRHGIQCFSYMYGTAALFSWYCTMHLILLSIDYYLTRSKSTFIFIILNIILWFFTMRARAIAFSFIYIALFCIYIYYEKTHKKFELKLYFFVIVGALALIFAWDQIVYYFTTDTQPRSILLNTGIDIFIRFLPLGAGFGTFGTPAASRYYSPIYYEYGFDKIYGFNIKTPYYLTDTFWPAVMAETGLFGTVFYVLFIGIILIFMYRKSSRDNFSKITMFYFIVTLLASSIATTIFTHNVTIADVFFLSMIPNLVKTNKYIIADNKNNFANRELQ